ncbi:MAG: hypothetical protein RLZZ457_1001 [Pseudomonadota bacterium]|jgi:uncharacterized protein involved in type VI secretion and phage assembly
MEQANHTLSELFKQLGLANDRKSIEAFVKSHRPLNTSTRLEDASFWTPSQSHFIKEQLANDADWAELIDQLSLALR